MNTETVPPEPKNAIAFISDMAYISEEAQEPHNHSEVGRFEFFLIPRGFTGFVL